MMAESVRPDAVIRRLQDSLDRGAGLCLLAGAGLTIAATGDTANSWPELIKRGAVACLENGHRDQPWVDRVAADVATGRTWDMLGAAEKVTHGFGETDTGQFFEWLRVAVGALEPKHFELLDQIKRLAGHPKVVVVTTNYDGLLARHLGFERVTWKQDAPVLLDAFSHLFEAVIHIHGYWLEPSSVVFGSTSYAALSADRTAIEGLKQMLMANTVVTVGVGAGITDPTFQALLDWADDALKQARAIFYLHEVGAEVPEHPGIVRVPLPSYEELVKFLQQIQVKPRPARGSAQDITAAVQSPVDTLEWVRDRAASARRSTVALRARQYMGIYGDQVDRILAGEVTPNARAKAWADRLVATWEALENP
jgi:hypothetical protein